MSAFGGNEDGMDMESDMMYFNRDSNVENRGENSPQPLDAMYESVKGPFSSEPTSTTYSIGRSNSFTEDMVFGSANEDTSGLPAFGLPPQDPNQADVPSTPTK